jgi:hypothetical protein
MSRVRFLAKARYLYSFHDIQAGSEVHIASYAMGVVKFFPEGEVAEA